MAEIRNWLGEHIPAFVKSYGPWVLLVFVLVGIFTVWLFGDSINEFVRLWLG